MPIDPCCSSISSGPLHGGANEAVIRMLISIGKSVLFYNIVHGIEAHCMSA